MPDKSYYRSAYEEQPGLPDFKELDLSEIEK